MQHARTWIVASVLIGLAASAAAAGFDVSVELENLSSWDKRDWPVILPVYHLFGRNLPPGSLHKDGYHVYDPQGREIPFTIEELPPYGQQGNDELIFLVPTMGKGQTLTFRVTNTATPSRKRTTFDLVSNPNNLVANGGFEQGAATPEGWQRQGKRDTDVKRSGRASLRLRGSTRQEALHARKIPLHRGSHYYFGAWTRTRNVSRHALYRSKGGHIQLPGFHNWFNGQPRSWQHYTKQSAGQPYQACATRDWWKIRFKNSGYDRWGFPRVNARAEADATTLTAILDQRPQFHMEGKAEGTWWLDDLWLFEQPAWTVRHDQALEPHAKDGLFVFTRPSNTPIGNLCGGWVSTFVSWPFPHEKAESLDRAAMRGQRVPFVLGLFHTRELGRLALGLQGGALRGPAGQELKLAEIECIRGMTPPERNHLLYPYEGPIALAAPSKARRQEAAAPAVGEDPTIDGKITEPVWQKALTLKLEERLDGGGAASQPTEVLVARIGTVLYLAFRCVESRPDAIRGKDYGKRDGPVWEGDSVELFLGDGATYFHYAVNAAGSLYDAKEKNKGWNSRARAAAGRDAKGWVAELAVPLDALFALHGGKALDKARLNVTRNRYAGGRPEESAWSPTFSASSHVPDRFGTLWLAARPKTAPKPSPAAPAIRYAVLSFEVPESARPGKYRGAVQLRFLDRPKLDRAIPLQIRVQDLAKPTIRDTFIGMIFQSESVPFNDEGLRQYSKSGFTSLTRFGNFFEYARRAGGYEIDLEKTGKKIAWLRSYGITAGICPFSDLDLGLRWGGGRLYKSTVGRTDITSLPAPKPTIGEHAPDGGLELDDKPKKPTKEPTGWHAKGNKAAWQHEIKRIDAYVRQHPDWPQMIYMTWDEPGYGPHGMPGPKMGWVNEVLPKAWTTLDAHFYVFERILPYYTMPNFDDPADFCGPDIYGYLKKLGKSYGFAAAQEPGETQRYQTGMMMLASGARYLHVWHLAGGQKLMQTERGKVLRSMGMVANGEGVDDFKACRLLRSLMQKAEKDPSKRRALEAAQAYLDKVFGLWTADHLYGTSHLYLGHAAEWGCDRFYNDWQEAMLKLAAALKGVPWVE